MKFLDNVGEPSYFPMPLPDLLCYVSFSRYSPLSFEVVENRTNVKVFWLLMFFRRDDPKFSMHFVSTIYRPPFGKVWFSSVC